MPLRELGRVRRGAARGEAHALRARRLAPRVALRVSLARARAARAAGHASSETAHATSASASQGSNRTRLASSCHRQLGRESESEREGG